MYVQEGKHLYQNHLASKAAKYLNSQSGVYIQRFSREQDYIPAMAQATSDPQYPAALLLMLLGVAQSACQALLQLQQPRCSDSLYREEPVDCNVHICMPHQVLTCTTRSHMV